ncbi:exosortase family protein XrtF [Flavobacterium sp. LaA7.5]|nr:exosortase family protein XrtF [Flavobacterium salilacus subsp. altitudinum]
MWHSCNNFSSRRPLFWYSILVTFGFSSSNVIFVYFFTTNVFIKPHFILLIFVKNYLMSVWQKNRPFFLFLIKFGLSYLILSVLYSLYLRQFDADNFEVDGMTTLVAQQSEYIVEVIGKEAHIKPHLKEASYVFYVNNDSVARIVEGCNAVSVMILFTAFIIAFSTTFKRTSLYIIAGIVLIHILNIVRIALLGLGFYYYPQYEELMHDILFPLFIYGVVFALWVVWVMKLSGNAKEDKA